MSMNLLRDVNNIVIVFVVEMVMEIKKLHHMKNDLDRPLTWVESGSNFLNLVESFLIQFYFL